MKKLVAYICAFLLVSFLPLSGVQEAKALADCSWIQGTGCNLAGHCDDWCGVDVVQGEGGWMMTIECDSGDGGTWSGSGEWGGDCPN